MVSALTKQCIDSSCLKGLLTSAKVPLIYHDIAMDNKCR